MKTTIEDEDLAAQAREDLIPWLRRKIDEAEKSVRAREQSEAVWRSGTDESWAIAAELHPDTAGKPIPKAARILAAEGQRRIAAKCRHEVAMFKAALAAIQETK